MARIGEYLCDTFVIWVWLVWFLLAMGYVWSFVLRDIGRSGAFCGAIRVGEIGIQRDGQSTGLELCFLQWILMIKLRNMEKVIQMMAVVNKTFNNVGSGHVSEQADIIKKVGVKVKMVWSQCCLGQFMASMIG